MSSLVPPIDQRKGVVQEAEAASFDGMAATAGCVEAKGVFFNRGPHRKEAQIRKWLAGKEEAEFENGEICQGLLLVAPPTEDDFDVDPADIELSTPKEIEEACQELVADLPTSFRKAVAEDAKGLVAMCRRACPDVPWITLRLEMCQKQACWRWHQDAYVGRSIITYVGPSTVVAEDKVVRWERFEETADQRRNLECVPEEDVVQMTTNSVLLMKGDSWPGLRGMGLTHKSPEEPGEPEKRLILKVDLTRTRPPLWDDDSDEEGSGSEEEEEEEEEGDEGAAAGAGQGQEEEEQPVMLKRLADSVGFKGAGKPTKRRR